MDAPQLTEAQASIAQAIATFRQTHEFGPTVRQVAAATDRALSTTQELLRTLRHKGAVVWDDGVARSLRLTEAGQEALHAASK